MQELQLGIMESRADKLENSILLDRIRLQRLERRILCFESDELGILERAAGNALESLNEMDIPESPAAMARRISKKFVNTFSDSTSVLLRKLDRVSSRSGRDNRDYATVADFVAHPAATASHSQTLIGFDGKKHAGRRCVLFGVRGRLLGFFVEGLVRLEQCCRQREQRNKGNHGHSCWRSACRSGTRRCHELPPIRPLRQHDMVEPRHASGCLARRTDPCLGLLRVREHEGRHENRVIKKIPTTKAIRINQKHPINCYYYV